MKLMLSSDTWIWEGIFFLITTIASRYSSQDLQQASDLVKD